MSPSGGPTLSVVIPAYNEAAGLPATLTELNKAVTAYRAAGLGEAEVIVVDNNSADNTSETAEAHGARAVEEPTQGIGHARNAGANAANASRLYFMDADVTVPSDVLIAIRRALDTPGCYGGAVAPDYRPKSKVTRAYNQMWAAYARSHHMTQGVSQFATREAFDAVGGYDTHWMAEDTVFGHALRKYARQRGGFVTVITDPMVIPSTRRMDEWGPWKTIWRTNPIITRMRRRSPTAWAHWYGEKTVR